MKNSTDIKELNLLGEEVSSMLKPMLLIEVKDMATASDAAIALNQVKTYAKKVDAVRKSLTEPYRLKVNQINDYAKGLSTPLEEAEKHIKTQLASFEIEQEKIRKAEIEKLEQEKRRQQEELAKMLEAEKASKMAEINDTSEAAALFGDDGESEDTTSKLQEELNAKRIAEEAALYNQHSQREAEIRSQRVSNSARVWKVKLIDINLVPDEFVIKELNTSAVLAVLRNGGKVAGCEGYQEVSIRSGSNLYIPRQVK